MLPLPIRTIIHLVIVGFCLSISPTYAEKVQSQLHVSVVVTGQCSIHAPFTGEQEHRPITPGIYCDHPHPIRYRWDNQREHEAGIEGKYHLENIHYKVKPVHDDSQKQHQGFTEQQSENGQNHTLTILY
jgi:hypothetical protein